jgi:hypothetical protein
MNIVTRGMGGTCHSLNTSGLGGCPQQVRGGGYVVPGVFRKPTQYQEDPLLEQLLHEDEEILAAIVLAVSRGLI